MAIVDNLARACERVGEKYFLLTEVGRKQPVKRERVYCYELYHQLRKELDGAELSLMGEPDKSGNTDFGRGRQLNPDFIFHFPGNHEQNAAVVEVEWSVSLKHLKKDLRNLKVMQSKNYNELILLLFSVSEVPWDKLIVAAKEVSLNLAHVQVLLHSSAGSPAVVCQPPICVAS